jgi:uncharacterized membrane protein
LSERSARVLLIALSVVGLLISVYLTWVHFRGVAPLCLTGSGGCERVQTSPYAIIFGLPIATLGLGAYVGLLAAALLRGEIGVFFGLFVTLVGTLFSAYLTWLELFVIHAICQYCVASAILMMASLVLAIVRFRQLRADPKRPG